MGRRRSGCSGLIGLVFLFALIIWPVANLCSQVILAICAFADAHPFVASCIALISVVSTGVLLKKVVLPWWRRHKAEEQRKRAVTAWWLSLDGRMLEQESARLYAKLGYHVEHRGGAGDEGVDLLLRGNQQSIVVQCKAYAKPIGPHVVRELYGTLLSERANYAVLVAPHGFTAAASRWAGGKPIQLLDATGLAILSHSALR